jgi:hypothetical protein
MTAFLLLMEAMTVPKQEWKGCTPQLLHKITNGVPRSSLSMHKSGNNEMQISESRPFQIPAKCVDTLWDTYNIPFMAVTQIRLYSIEQYGGKLELPANLRGHAVA